MGRFHDGMLKVISSTITYLLTYTEAIMHFINANLSVIKYINNFTVSSIEAKYVLLFQCQYEMFI